MLHLRNIVKSAVMAKDLTRVLPIAVSQTRGYSDHQIPERLREIPNQKDPLFFEMVR